MPRPLALAFLIVSLAACSQREEASSGYPEYASSNNRATVPAAEPFVVDEEPGAPVTLEEAMGEAEDLTPWTMFYEPSLREKMMSRAELEAEFRLQEVASATEQSGDANQPAAAPSGSIPQLAYSYNYGLESPPRRVRELMNRHEKACRDAGPKVCQVVTSTLREDGRDQISGRIVLRAEPRWLAGFRQALPEDAQDVGGRVVATSVESEDLSRQIVDAEAKLKAMTTLRDRLQGLLAARPGNLKELLDLEKELARVQGEIDSATSQLSMMRTRVSTSRVTLEYFSRGVLAPQGVFGPLGRAISDFLGLMIGTIAILIRALAVLIPLGLAIAGVVWLIRKLVPGAFQRRRKKAEALKAAVREALREEATGPPPSP